jgi:hypothetical protein
MKQQQRHHLFLIALVSGTLMLGGCLVRGGFAVHSEPQLVSVAPGVWVVEDYDEPVFFNDGYYWRYYGNTWYRSRVHNNGWVVVHNGYVPRVIVGIDRPRSYVHYRARPGARVRRAEPYNRRSAPARRRAKPAPRVHDHRSKPRPNVHDHRDNKRRKHR